MIFSTGKVFGKIAPVLQGGGFEVFMEQKTCYFRVFCHKLLMRCWLLCLSLCLVSSLKGLEIKVDYRFDTAGFFDQPGAKEAIEAAAARWSRVIDQKLLPVDIRDEEFNDRRIIIIHPETNQEYHLSVAQKEESDFIAQRGGRVANEYLGEFLLGEDELIYFVGSRPLASLAEAGPLGAFHYTISGAVSDADDPSSFLNRGFNVGKDSLIVLGGFAAFSTNVDWNFDLSAPNNAVGFDLYSVALHEIGHSLGLNTDNAMEWTDLVVKGRFMGENAVIAYNNDTGRMEASLEMHSSSSNNFHWLNNTYDSRIFALGSPRLQGTAGLNGLQDLLMEPGAAFGSYSRFEITNVDAASLRDIGWSVITEDPPLPPALPLEFSVADGGGLSLCIASKEGSTYTIQTSNDGVNWQDVTPSLVGNGSALCWADGDEGFTDPYGAAAELSAKFYRVIEN